jgi:ABC-type multidrug transport system ATPase subunit
VNTIARQVRGHQNISIAVVSEMERAEAILMGMTDLVREVKMTNGLRQLNETSAEDLRTQTLQRENYSSKGSVLQVSYIGEPDEEHRILTTLVEAGIKVRAFYTPETDLEDVFLRVTKGQVA